MTIIIFDTSLTLSKLYPLSLTRPVCEIRHGLFTQSEWYALASGLPVYSVSAPYFGKISPLLQAAPYLCIDSSIVPDTELLKKLLSLNEGASLEDSNGIIGYVSPTAPVFDRFPLFFSDTLITEPVSRINHPMDWVKTNAGKIISDFTLLPKTGIGTADRERNLIIGEHPVYLEEGAKVSLGVIFNTEDGPVYIGKNALVMEAVCVRGPVAIMEGAVVKMGAQIYQGTTIGKFVVAGGEIKNSIIGDYSNKAHHGYLGDSIIGQWCNLGAGTSNSNVKNNAGEISMWHQAYNKMMPVGKKAGMAMGDYSKTAINISLNTGTTIGACCSIHLSGLPAKHIPSFSWGPGEFYDCKKALTDLENWYQFKKHPMEAGVASILEHLWQTRKLQ